MKVSAVGAQAAPVNPNEGSSAPPDRWARAVAAMKGEKVPEKAPEPEKEKASIHSIKMKTQMSPKLVAENATVAEIPQTQPVVDKVDNIEQTAAASDATKPLSPQFAALAKKERALQVKERELAAKEAQLTSQGTDKASLDAYKADLKAKPLRTLLAEGVTYDQLTEEILSGNVDPVSPAYGKLESQINELKTLLEQKDKAQEAREQATRQQVLNQMKKDLAPIIATGDDYAMIREAGYASEVVRLIDETEKSTGEVLDIEEAAKLVEEQLLEDSLKWAKIGKVQSRLAPPPTPTPEIKQDTSNRKIMRTLTNRDGTSVPMSPRERAIAAFYGKLK